MYSPARLERIQWSDDVMHSRKEPLTRRERIELQGYVSNAAVATRAVLFLLAVAVVAALSWRVQQALSLSAPLWFVPTVAVAVLLYVRARRWTGGRELRDNVRGDLQANAALVHRVTVRDAIVFAQREDEGPIVFLLTDDNETLVFTGQELSRYVDRGFPWREFDIRESAASRRFLRIKRLGERLTPSAMKPPLSPEQYDMLRLAGVAHWQRLDVPFEQLRHVA